MNGLYLLAGVSAVSVLIAIVCYGCRRRQWKKAEAAECEAWQRRIARAKAGK